MRDKILLRTTKLSKYFGGIKAVDNLSYTIKERELTALIGPNGAGKTTFINLITGFLKPDHGNIFFSGENEITRLPPYERARLGIVRTFQLTSVFSKLSVYENLELVVKTKKNDKKADVYSLAKMVGLEDQLDKMAGTLSVGDKKKLELSMAMGLKPVLLMLDEPFAGLSESEIDELIIPFKNLAKQITFFIVEHKISKILPISQRLSILYGGKIIADGDPYEVIDKPIVKKLYWGHE